MRMAARCRQGISFPNKTVGARRPTSTAPEAPMRIILVATAVAAAMSRSAGKPSLRDALVRTDGDRRRGHVRELYPAHLRDVRAGGDCGQPRLLHSEPALAGPHAVSPAAERPAKAR